MNFKGAGILFNGRRWYLFGNDNKKQRRTSPNLQTYKI
jgi:hypothetical protein